MYDSVRYANSRLAHTYVLLEGQLCLVQECFSAEGEIMVSLLSLKEGGNSITTTLNSLDLKPPTIGWVNNYEDGINTSYIVRVPKRRDWRQGLRENNLKSLFGSSTIVWRNIAKSIKGIYPSTNEALKVSKTLEIPIGISNHWAINPKSKLLYKSFGEVGSLDDEQVTLNKDRQYLMEVLPC